MKIAISENAWAPYEERRVLPMLDAVEGVCISFQRLESGVRSVRQSVHTRARTKKRELMAHDLEIPLMECVADSRHGNLHNEEGRARLVERMELALEVCHELESPAITLVGPSLRRTPDFKPHLWVDDWLYLEDKATQYGITMILEPAPRIHATRFWHTAESVDGFLTAARSLACVGVDTAALAFEEKPRSVLGQFAGQVPIITISEPGQGPIAARGPVPHRRLAADMSRLKKAGRVPEWIALRYRRPDQAVLETVSASVERLRILYASVLR